MVPRFVIGYSGLLRLQIKRRCFSCLRNCATKWLKEGTAIWDTDSLTYISETDQIMAFLWNVQGANILKMNNQFNKSQTFILTNKREAQTAE